MHTIGIDINISHFKLQRLIVYHVQMYRFMYNYVCQKCDVYFLFVLRDNVKV